MPKKSINVELGKRVRMRREFLRLTREQLAEQVDLSPRFINSLENGSSGVKLESLSRLAEALDTTCDYLVCGDRLSHLQFNLEKLLLDLRHDDRADLYDLLEHMIKTYQNLLKK